MEPANERVEGSDGASVIVDRVHAIHSSFLSLKYAEICVGSLLGVGF